MAVSRNPAVLPTVTFPDLSDRQAAFVREYVERGGRPGAGPDAAVAAGYAQPGPGGRAAARVRASELLRNPDVLQVLRDELTRKLNAGAALGVQALIDLCQNARSEQVRLAAANSLIDRGLAPVMSRNATIQANASIEDLLAMLDAPERASLPPMNYSTDNSREIEHEISKATTGEDAEPEQGYQAPPVQKALSSTVPPKSARA